MPINNIRHMTITLEAKKREGKAEATREAGLIPAIVYGSDMESTSIAVPARVFSKVYEEAGESTIIDLVIDGEKEPIQVIIQDIQNDPLKNTPLHIDFKHIIAGQEMHAVIELEFVGETLAVKEQGGTLITGISSVNVKCLPSALVHYIQVDLSALQTFEDTILLSDIVVPTGVTITDNMDTLVAKVTEPKSAAELEAEDAVTAPAPAIDTIAVEKKGKKEEVEGDGATKDVKAKDAK
jgi:large subunit ribosomal protein L25